MFDFGVGYSELFVLALVAVIVIGPKDLPKVLRTFGNFMTKARRMAAEFQGHVDVAMKDSGVVDLKKDLADAKNQFSSVINTPNIMSPIVQSQQAGGARSFDAFFGSEGATGETKVQGKALVDADKPA